MVSGAGVPDDRSSNLYRRASEQQLKKQRKAICQIMDIFPDSIHGITDYLSGTGYFQRRALDEDQKLAKSKHSAAMAKMKEVRAEAKAKAVAAGSTNQLPASSLGKMTVEQLIRVLNSISPGLCSPTLACRSARRGRPRFAALKICFGRRAVVHLSC